jgi:hypothetical protein
VDRQVVDVRELGQPHKKNIFPLNKTGEFATKSKKSAMRGGNGAY